MVGPDEDAPEDGGGLVAEIIVVENSSSDHSLAMLARFPQVRVLAQTENVGFTRGNNLALAAARGRHVSLLTRTPR